MAAARPRRLASSDDKGVPVYGPAALAHDAAGGSADAARGNHDQAEPAATRVVRGMTGRVFISHSSTDHGAADMLRAALEDAGCSCWIAPRDIAPGSPWAASIMAGIAAAEVLVLVHSAASSASEMVLREINAAADGRKHLIPVRIDATPVRDAMQFYLGATHWLDASSGRLDEHLVDIVAAVSERLGLPALPAAPAVPVPPERPAIAVLPFQNMSGDAEQAYFADGITEDIITELSRFRFLFVIARNSSSSYKGQAEEPRRVAQELGVRYVLQGSVRKAGDRVRVNAQLSDGTTGAHLWAERYDRTLEDIFAVQEEVTRGVVSAVATEIERAEIAQARRPAPHDTAPRLTWRAHGLMADGVRNGQASLVLEAIDTARQAISADPGDIAACNVIAWSYLTCHLHRWGPTPATALDNIWQAAEQMQRIAPLDHRTLTICGIVRTMRGQHERGVADLRRAVDSNPNASQSLMWLAASEAMAGESEPAMVHARLGMRLNPRDAWIGIAQLAMAMAEFCAGRFAEAAGWADLAIQSEPGVPVRRAVMVACCAHLGDRERAIRQRVELDAIAPDFLPSLLRGDIAVFRRPEDMTRLLDGVALAGAGP